MKKMWRENVDRKCGEKMFRYVRSKSWMVGKDKLVT